MGRGIASWRVAAALIASVALAIALFAAQRLAVARSDAAVERRARASAILLAASFRRELEKFRLVPIVLAEDREARDALSTRDPARLRALNAKLEALSAQTRAANVYLLDAQGRTVAASNWRRPESFLGDSYAFRAYYREAMRAGAAQQFALGQRSRQPGLYISRRLGTAARPLGVFVVKVDFRALEREWRQTASAAFVSDARGIILITADPAWRFQTVRHLTADERDQARRSLEYGGAPLAENALYAAGAIAPAGSGRIGRAYIEASESVGGWRVTALEPAAAARTSAVAFARLAVAIGALAIAGLYLLWRVRRRAEAARSEARTNARLGVLREQLVQANKLATLGQITAGVGHEIAQPVATIAAHAHNARALLDRKRLAEAGEAIDAIGGLTTRIGLITRELRGFARRATGAVGAVDVHAAFDGVALLLRERLRNLGAVLVVEGPPIAVAAERVRLEQVLMNLVQNALDAGATRISATIEPMGERVRIVVADDGPGLSPDIRATLFHPFTTSKHDGLGLGLVISHDIVAELGGTLVAGTPAGGAEFVVELKRAP